MNKHTSIRPIRILFVCLGNICRSPMAEAIFRHKVKNAGLERHFFIDSAGTGDWHVGNRPHDGTITILNDHGIDSKGIFSRQITQSDLEEYDYILAMDHQNVQSIHLMFDSVPEDRIQLLLDYVPDMEDKNVPDPYITGNFDEVYQMIDRACERLLTQIREKEGL